MLIIECPNCNYEIGADVSLKGHEITCTSCNAQLRVPLGDSVSIGNVLDDYEITDILGAGSMGMVFLALQKMMNRNVAIKTIKPDIRDDESSVDSFIQEMQVAAQLDHPNIVTVYGAGRCDDVYYVSMQYIEGFDINEKVDSDGPITENISLEIIKCVADALKYSWDKLSMIHRDIKPENIRLSYEGRVLVMDLGLAKMTSSSASSASTSGMIVGTPDFISPEQGQGLKGVDFHTDMYSLGYVLVYLLTGERAYKAETPMGVVAMHISEPTPNIRELNPDVEISHGCIQLIDKLTRKSAGERFDTWQDVIDAINKVLTGSPIYKEKKNKGKSTNTIRLSVPAGVSRGNLLRKSVPGITGTKRNQKSAKMAIMKSRRRSKKKSSSFGFTLFMIVGFLMLVLGTLLAYTIN